MNEEGRMSLSVPGLATKNQPGMDGGCRRRAASMDSIPYADADVASVGSANYMSSNEDFLERGGHVWSPLSPIPRVVGVSTDDDASLNNLLDALGSDVASIDPSCSDPQWSESPSPNLVREVRANSASLNRMVTSTPMGSLENNLSEKVPLVNGNSMEGGAKVHFQELPVNHVSPADAPQTQTLTTHYISSARAFNREDKDHSRSSRAAAKLRKKEQQVLHKVGETLRQRYKSSTEAFTKQTVSTVPIPTEQTLRLQTYQPCLQVVTDTNRNLPIHLEQILTTHQGNDGVWSEIPRCVAVTGNLGYGKTTLCLKILHDWAVQQSPYLSIYQLVFFVQIREYKAPLQQYVHRELLEKKSLTKDEVKILWKWVKANESKVLFVLDGYGEQEDGENVDDLMELIDGKTFPDSQVLVTCRVDMFDKLAPRCGRRLRILGFDWPQIQLSIRCFFTGKLTESGSKLLQLLADEEDRFLPLVSCPLLCFALCSVFESCGETLPANNSDLYLAIVKFLVRQYSNGSASGDVPARCRDVLVDLGKEALKNVRTGRWYFSEAPNVAEAGFLRKLWSFGRGQRKDYYQPLHESFTPFLSAYYISSVASYTNILRRELEAIPDERILRFLVGLLGKKAFLVFSLLSPMDFAPRALFSLLHESGGWDGNVNAVCILLSAIMRVQIRSHQVDIRGWSLLLRSPRCSVDSVEVLLQPDSICTSKVQDLFLALSQNEGVNAVKLNCLLGHELTGPQIWRMAEYIGEVLTKPRLKTLEVVISCMEGDTQHETFQPVLDTIIQAITRGYCTCLEKLIIDADLDADQICQLCAVLQLDPKVSVLHLPHLGCGKEGLQFVAELVLTKPLVSLNLSGCWQSTNDEDANSSETDKFSPFQLLVKTAPSPKKQSKTPFFSLPRGGVNMYSSLCRDSPVLRRDDKRHSDSILFQKAFLPLPLCDADNHTSGMHHVFHAAREKECRLQSLNVSKCSMTGEDFMCLGETVRKSKCLTALRMEGVSSIGDSLPVIVALNENPCLQLLDLSSAHVAVGDKPFQMICQSLTKNSSLRLVCLEGWSFKLEEEESMDAFVGLLPKMGIRDVSLTNCRIHVSTPDGKLSFIGKPDSMVHNLLQALTGVKCTSVAFLRLSGLELDINKKMSLKGPELLPFLKPFTRLGYLNLSLDKRLGGEYHIDEKMLITFFQTLVQTFPDLRNLRICNWRLRLEDPEKTLKLVGKSLLKSAISSLKIDGLVAWDSGEKQPVEFLFILSLITNMTHLSSLSLTDIMLHPMQADAIGRRIRDGFSGSNLELFVKGIPLESVRSLLCALTEGNKTEAVYVGGQQCVIKVKKAVKSTNFMGRLLRFTSGKS